MHCVLIQDSRAATFSSNLEEKAMKAIKTLFVVSALAAAVSAQAATYAVTGAVSINDVISGPGLGGISLGTEIDFVYSTAPVFSASWTFDAAAASGIAGGLNFVPYDVVANPKPGGLLEGLFGEATVSYQGDNYVIAGGTGSWDAGTLTYTLSGAQLTGGVQPLASGDPTAVAALGGFANNPLAFSLSLTFSDASLTSFTGTAHGLDFITDPDLAELVDHQDTTYTFSGTVPVPAAAWLFGSGLLGLAGTARRRRNAA